MTLLKPPHMFDLGPVGGKRMVITSSMWHGENKRSIMTSWSVSQWLNPYYEDIDDRKALICHDHDEL